MQTVTALKVLQRITNEQRSIESELPASYMAVLLSTARHISETNEPPTFEEVSHSIGIGRPSLSRIFRALSDGRTKGGKEKHYPALGLVQILDGMTGLRDQRVALTKKGESFVSRLEAAVVSVQST